MSDMRDGIGEVLSREPADPDAGRAGGQLTPEDYQWNFRVGVIDGAVITIAIACTDPTTVLSWFLAQLGASNILIGLVQPIRMGSSFLLQIFVSGYLQRKPLKMPFCLTVAAVRSLLLAVMALVVALIPVASPWLVPAFFAALTLYSLISGTIMLPFLDIVGKSILPTDRGKFFGQRNFWGNILLLGTSALVGYLLSEPLGLDFPLNVAVLFALSAALIGVTFVVWGLIREPESVVDSSRVRWSEQLRRGVALLKRDPGYRRFVLVRLALAPADWIIPFYVVYAKDQLGIPPQMIGVYLAVRTAAAVFSNLVWTGVSKRHGNRAIVQAASALAISIPLLALAVGFVIDRSPSGGQWQPYAFGLVFLALGAFGSGTLIADLSYLLDIVPEAERSLYLGFNNTLFGLARMSALASGFLINWMGFRALSVVVAAFCMLSLILSFGLVHPVAHPKSPDRRGLVPSAEKRQAYSAVTRD